MLFLLLIIVSCNTENKKEYISESYHELADNSLSPEVEKILLISTIKKISYDTVYNILRDYEAMYLEYEYKEDSLVFVYDNTIQSISKNYLLPESKIASIIFSFKYEMRTREDLISELKQDAYDDQAAQQYDDGDRGY